MQIKFIGMPGEQHDSITMYGKEFPLNKAVDSKGLTPRQEATLAAHPHFQTSGDVSVDPVQAETNQLVEKVAQDMANLELAQVEHAKAAEAETQAKLTQEQKYGEPIPVSRTDTPEAESAGRERNGQRGRPPKGR